MNNLLRSNTEGVNYYILYSKDVTPFSLMNSEANLNRLTAASSKSVAEAIGSPLQASTFLWSELFVLSQLEIFIPKIYTVTPNFGKFIKR